MCYFLLLQFHYNGFLVQVNPFFFKKGVGQYFLQFTILQVGATEPLTESNCVAYRVSQYSTLTTKKGDWWLPNKSELNLMHMNDVCNDDDRRYWNSSQLNRSYACAQYFDLGGRVLFLYKTDYYQVRGIRAF